jgi:hypothetical protein
MLYIFNYFSIWLLIWFLLYKLKIIKIQPSLNYIFAFIYISFKIIAYFFLKPVDFDIFFTNMLISMMLDIIPLVSMLPLDLTSTTISYNLYYLFSYLLTLGLFNIDIVKLYFNDLTYNFYIKK